MKKLLFTTAFISIAGAASFASAEELNLKLSYADAKKIAMEAITKKLEIEETELEREEGEEWSYEVEISLGEAVWEVEIDANTGKILEIEEEE